MNNENDEAPAFAKLRRGKRMTNVEGMTKPEFQREAVRFVIRHLVLPSSFVIRISSL
jgi:hypothetical protein